MSDVNDRIQDIVQADDVVLFMKGTPLFPQCGFSSRAVAILDHCGVAFGSVAPTPIRATPIEKLLEGKPITDALVASAVAMVPQIASPITDIRSSKEYRLHMLGVMLERALRAADSRFEGDGPEYGKELI